MSGKYRELGKNTAIFAMSLFLSKLVSSLLIPLYTRLLTTEEYGIADLVTTISHFIVPICSLSIYEAVFRFTIDQRKNKQDVIRCGVNIVWISCLLMIFTGFLLRAYNPISEWVVYLIILSAFTAIRNTLSLYTEAAGKTFLFGFDNIICNLLLGVANIIFLSILSFGLKGYFLAGIVSTFLSIVFLSSIQKIRLYPKIERGDSDLMKGMLEYSAPLVVNSISWVTMGMVDRIMLTSYYSSSENGLYAVASKIPTLLTVLTSVFTQAWGLSVIKDYEKEQDNDFYNNVFNFFHMIVLFGTCGILFFNNNLLQIIIGKEFCDALRYIPLLLMGTVFLTYSNFYSPIYSANKKSNKIARTSFCGLLINLLLNTVLIPKTGIAGACLATAVSYIVIGIYRMIDCRKYISLSFDKSKWMISLILLCIQCYFVSVDKADLTICSIVLGTVILLYRKYIVEMGNKIMKRL